MITYSIYIDNKYVSTIQADSRQEAVALAHAEYNTKNIHLSKEGSTGAMR